MKIKGIFVLMMIVKGAFAWWAAALRAGIEPVLISFGAAFAAIGLNQDRPNLNVFH